MTTGVRSQNKKKERSKEPINKNTLFRAEGKLLIVKT